MQRKFCCCDHSLDHHHGCNVRHFTRRTHNVVTLNHEIGGNHLNSPRWFQARILEPSSLEYWYRKRFKKHETRNRTSRICWIDPKTTATFIISILFLELFAILAQLPAVLASTSLFNNYTVAMLQNRNSGQLTMSQLCATRSHFPTTKRIEGTILSSNFQDTEMNCTILLRTKSAQQHFVLRFEELKLGCDDHLVLFESDYDYGQPSIADLSCRDNLANVPIIKTTGNFLTLRYTTDRTKKADDGFRAIVTAVFDQSLSADCPPEYAFCRNHLCISKSLFCDGINHCLDETDELGCDDLGGRNDLSYALALLIVLVLVISVCVIVFITAIYCRRESPYSQYQHHIQRAFGVPLQTSSSLMFTNQPTQYQFFHQPANLSPFVTPQHHATALAATTTTLPRGYSTLPLNLARPISQRHPQSVLHGKPNANHIDEQNNNPDYLMMTTYSGPQIQPSTSTLQTNPTMQANLILPTSQSILPVNAVHYQTQPFPALQPR